jgi:hypothetical protein
VNYTEQLSEGLAVVSTIDPQLLDNATANGDYVDMSKFRRVMFVFAVGAIDAVLDFSLREAQDTGGTGEAAITGKAITQFTATDDNKQAIIEVAAEELSAGYRYVRPRVVGADGAAGGQIVVIGLGGNARFSPASDNDLASVAEIIV